MSELFSGLKSFPVARCRDRELWRSPDGDVIRRQAKAVITSYVSFSLDHTPVTGHCRRPTFCVCTLFLDHMFRPERHICAPPAAQAASLCW
jgi:hypothetical protein